MFMQMPPARLKPPPLYPPSRMLFCSHPWRRIEGFLGVEYREYRQEAVREALVHAVAYRDYSRRGQRRGVFRFDNRIEVYSPGLLPPGVSL